MLRHGEWGQAAQPILPRNPPPALAPVYHIL
jgi:hypothetical protein